MRAPLALLVLLGGVAHAKPKKDADLDGAYAMSGGKEKGKIAGDSLCARPAPGEPIMFKVAKGKLTAHYPIGYDGGIVLDLSAKVTKKGAISGTYKAPQGSRALWWSGVKISGKVDGHAGSVTLARDGASCAFKLVGPARD